MRKKLSPPAEKACYICASTAKFIDGHHVDCQEGKLSPEKVPLCRRCHRTYHDLGVDYFDDEYLDKAIELENRRREVWYDKGRSPEKRLVLLKREDIQRSYYWNKIHGIIKRRKQPRETTNERQLGFEIIVDTPQH